VVKAPLGGGAPVTLSSRPEGPDKIAVDAANVYWTTSLFVKKVPLGGGTPTTLKSDTVHYPTAIAVDATNVYWTDINFGFAGVDRVVKSSLDGSQVTALVSDQMNPSAIAVDSTSIYWTNGDEDTAVLPTTGTVVKMALSGGTPITLAIRQANPQAMAIDATSIYWLNYGTGSVIKLTPK